MRARLLKEYRQLRPAWIVALLLAAIPARMGAPFDQFELVLFACGLAGLAVSSMGPEFAHRTFAMLTAQPIPRTRIMVEKVAMLTAVSMVVLGVFWLTIFLEPSHQGLVNSWNRNLLLILVPVILSGGLWSTLLVRQIPAAFCFTLLAPLAVGALIVWCLSVLGRDSHQMGGLSADLPIFVVYSIAGFWFAWRLYLRAEDYQWLGGEVSFSFRTRHAPVAKECSAFSRLGNWRVWALAKKELCLHQSAYWCAVGYVFLALGDIMVVRAMPNSPGTKPAIDPGLTTLFLWLLGLIMLPLIVGATSVAEERRLGTLEAQQSIPISRSCQFNVKLLVTLSLALLLGGLLPELMLKVMRITFPGEIEWPGLSFSIWRDGVIAPVAIALVACYISSFARSTLHAILFSIAAVPLAVVLTGMLGLFVDNGALLDCLGFDYRQNGVLLSMIVGTPVALALLLRLSFTNFCGRESSGRIWRANLAAWVSTVAAVLGVSTAVHQRLWELLPTEPRHGLRRISWDEPIKIRTTGEATAVLLPDGRLWLRNLSPFRSEEESRHWTSRLLEGSKWNDVALTSYGVYAIRSDGSLWNLPPLVPNLAVRDASPHQIGAETNWNSIAVGWRRRQPNLLAVRSDGTLWVFESAATSRYLVSFELATQIGRDANWVFATQIGGASLGAVKSDGSTWRIIGDPNTPSLLQDRESSQPLSQSTAANRTQFERDWQLARERSRLGPLFGASLERSADGNDWTEIASVHPDRRGWFITRRKDGALWAQSQNTTFRKISRQTDWVAVQGVEDTALAMSADGSLWMWPRLSLGWSWSVDVYRQWPAAKPTRLERWDRAWTALLSPSRKPIKIANLFE